MAVTRRIYYRGGTSGKTDAVLQMRTRDSSERTKAGVREKPETGVGGGGSEKREEPRALKLNGAGVRVVKVDRAGVRVVEGGWGWGKGARRNGMRSHLSRWGAWCEGTT